MVWLLFPPQAHARIAQWQHNPILKTVVETVGADKPIGHVQIWCWKRALPSQVPLRIVPIIHPRAGLMERMLIPVYVNEKRGGWAGP